jgi:hypothetical protein
VLVEERLGVGVRLLWRENQAAFVLLVITIILHELHDVGVVDKARIARLLLAQMGKLT